MSKRIGRTVVDEGGDEFLVVWPCAETALTRPAPPLEREDEARLVTTYAEGRRILLELLEQQATWRTKELLAEAMLPQAMFWALLQTMRRNGTTVNPDRGWVGLRRVTVAA
jgi:hypothetical protein